MPAMQAALCSFSRASVSSTSLTARTRYSNTSCIARMHSPSEKSLLHVQLYPSIACVSASIPVSAVSWGGMARAICGSTMAMSGTICRLMRLSFLWSSVSVSTTANVASEPVPDVVETQTSLHLAPSPKSVTNGLISSISISGRSYCTLIALAASMTDPPPTATIKSGACWLMRETPLRTVWSDGSGSTSSKTQPTDVSARASCSFTRSMRPRSTIFLSVTMNADFALNSAR